MALNLDPLLIYSYKTKLFVRASFFNNTSSFFFNYIEIAHYGFRGSLLNNQNVGSFNSKQYMTYKRHLTWVPLNSE